jgi:hypothetical protein
VLVHEDDLRRIDGGQIGANRSDHGVESTLGSLGEVRSTLSGAVGLGLIRFHHDDLPTDELERPDVDPGEADFQYTAGSVPQQLENVRRCSGGKSRRQSSHAKTLTFRHRGASRRG